MKPNNSPADMPDFPEIPKHDPVVDQYMQRRAAASSKEWHAVDPIEEEEARAAFQHFADGEGAIDPSQAPEALQEPAKHVGQVATRTQLA